MKLSLEFRLISSPRWKHLKLRPRNYTSKTKLILQNICASPAEMCLPISVSGASVLPAAQAGIPAASLGPPFPQLLTSRASGNPVGYGPDQASASPQPFGCSLGHLCPGSRPQPNQSHRWARSRPAPLSALCGLPAQSKSPTTARAKGSRIPRLFFPLLSLSYHYPRVALFSSHMGLVAVPHEYAPFQGLFISFSQSLEHSFSQIWAVCSLLSFSSPCECPSLKGGFPHPIHPRVCSAPAALYSISLPLWALLSISLLSDITRCSRIILLISCTRPRIGWS